MGTWAGYYNWLLDDLIDTHTHTHTLQPPNHCYEIYNILVISYGFDDCSKVMLGTRKTHISHLPTAAHTTCSCWTLVLVAERSLCFIAAFVIVTVLIPILALANWVSLSTHTFNLFICEIQFQIPLCLIDLFSRYPPVR